MTSGAGSDRAQELGRLVARDYTRGGRFDLPRVLAPYAPETESNNDKVLSLKRQQRAIAS